MKPVNIKYYCFTIETASSTYKLRQHSSVQMLTHVADRIETGLFVENSTTTATTTTASVADNLETQGYHVVDDFLDLEYVHQLQAELQNLYETATTTPTGGSGSGMTADVSQLGRGEFVVALKGGDLQYPQCPRSIEWVVGMTSQLSAQLNARRQQLPFLQTADLDDRACAQATARWWDRSVQLAAKALLLGDAADDSDSDTQDKGPLQTLAERDPVDPLPDGTQPEDLRTISVLYYLVSREWDDSSSGGGNLVFASGTVPAHQNRLVLWKSQETAYRREAFRGSEALATAGTMELHLVQRPSQKAK